MELVRDQIDGVHLLVCDDDALGVGATVKHAEHPKAGGGGWYSYADLCRVAVRYYHWPENRGHSYGFRCAKGYVTNFSGGEPYFMYQASSWGHERRVVAKIEWHQGELFPRVGFIVTNLPGRNKRVVRFYNQRGTAEQWIKEGKNAVKWTKLSCHDFVDNPVRHALPTRRAST